MGENRGWRRGSKIPAPGCYLTQVIVVQQKNHMIAFCHFCFLICMFLTQVMFNEESLPKGTGEYLLGYYSNNMTTLIGVTEPFQVSTCPVLCSKHCFWVLFLLEFFPFWLLIWTNIVTLPYALNCSIRTCQCTFAPSYVNFCSPFLFGPDLFTRFRTKLSLWQLRLQFRGR